MGYQICYSTDKEFKKNVKKKKVSGYKKTSVTLKKLKAKRTYYIKICTYYKMPSSTYYSAYSKVKRKKTK